MVPAEISTEPRQSTRPVHIATASPTTGESSDDTRRALSQAVTVSLLAARLLLLEVLAVEGLHDLVSPSRPCCRVEARSDWRLRTSRAAFLISLLTRNTKSASNGITVSAIRAKSQRSTNITIDHPEDREGVGDQVQRGDRGEALDRLHVVS